MPMTCACCGARQHSIDRIGRTLFARCRRCGLMWGRKADRNRIEDHYRDLDPHEKVAASKTGFFRTAVADLSTRVPGNGRTILDIGCGFGYFLECATRRGWHAYGVEVVADAVAAAAGRLGHDRVFHGTVQQAAFPDDTFDAVTSWDVLVVVDDPAAEACEYLRVLKPGGWVGLRVRNVVFQRGVYRACRWVLPVAKKIGVKTPYVFHNYCFSPASLRWLLHRAGFEEIRILNSPLTRGDPYAHTRFDWITNALKNVVDVGTRALHRISGGRWVLGPSLLVYGKKPG